MRRVIEFVCFVIGPTIVAFALVNFSSSFGRSYSNSTPYYYYDNGSKTGVAVGVFLIFLGFFLRWCRKVDKKND